MTSEVVANLAIDELIDGRWYDKRLRFDDPDGKRRWATKNAEGHVVEVNWEGETDLMVTDHWLSFLAAFSHLEDVHLDYNPELMGDGLKHLVGLPRIKWINLMGTAVRDEALAHMSKIETLEWLRLNDTEIGDDEVRHLARLRQLRGLELFRTPVSDAGLVHLEAMSALEHLDLNTQNVSEQGIERLRRVLPRCRILSRWTS
jgi:hypothetical protein